MTQPVKTHPFNPGPAEPNPFKPRSKNGSVWTLFLHPWIGPGGVFGPEPGRPGPLSTPTKDPATLLNYKKLITGDSYPSLLFSSSEQP
jgi:hypothetical protein